MTKELGRESEARKAFSGPAEIDTRERIAKETGLN